MGECSGLAFVGCVASKRPQWSSSFWFFSRGGGLRGMGGFPRNLYSYPRCLMVKIQRNHWTLTGHLFWPSFLMIVCFRFLAGNRARGCRSPHRYLQADGHLTLESYWAVALYSLWPSREELKTARVVVSWSGHVHTYNFGTRLSAWRRAAHPNLQPWQLTSQSFYP